MDTAVGSAAPPRRRSSNDPTGAAERKRQVGRLQLKLSDLERRRSCAATSTCTTSCSPRPRRWAHRRGLARRADARRCRPANAVPLEVDPGRPSTGPDGHASQAKRDPRSTAGPRGCRFCTKRASAPAPRGRSQGTRCGRRLTPDRRSHRYRTCGRAAARRRRDPLSVQRRACLGLSVRNSGHVTVRTRATAIQQLRPATPCHRFPVREGEYGRAARHVLRPGADGRPDDRGWPSSTRRDASTSGASG
jgi:hypothetical protein